MSCAQSGLCCAAGALLRHAAFIHVEITHMQQPKQACLLNVHCLHVLQNVDAIQS